VWRFELLGGGDAGFRYGRIVKFLLYIECIGVMDGQVGSLVIRRDEVR